MPVSPNNDAAEIAPRGTSQLISPSCKCLGLVQIARWSPTKFFSKDGPSVVSVNSTSGCEPFISDGLSGTVGLADAGSFSATGPLVEWNCCELCSCRQA